MCLKKKPIKTKYEEISLQYPLISSGNFSQRLIRFFTILHKA